MRRLLEERKATLELQVAARLRAAREGGAQADVKALSAALRTVKRQIAKLDTKPAIQGEAYA
jgi:chaperonin GroEL (HSP60 family)